MRMPSVCGGSNNKIEYHAVMAELADALDLGSSVNRRGGSSPSNRTIRESLSDCDSKNLGFSYIDEDSPESMQLKHLEVGF